MDFSKVRVLVTDGGARQTLTILHNLKELGCYVGVLCTHKLDVCYVSKLPDQKILDKRASASNKDYISFLVEVIQKGAFDVLLPVAEMNTNVITYNEDYLKKYVKLACAPRKAYINAFDKQRTLELAMQNNILVPYTRKIGQTVEDYIDTADFPIIIKPRNGVGSIGFHKFERKNDFWPYVIEKKLNLDDYVLQEFVPHKKRYGVVLFVDQNKNVCMAYTNEILRWYPIDAGSASLICSIDYPELIGDSAKLLKAMNWQGVAALSFMEDINTNEAKLLEINGRIPASIRLSCQCGFNVGKLLIEMAYEEKVERYPYNTKFGQLTRHFHAEVPWFIHSPDRFKCEPSWFSWKNTKDVVFWKDDLKPWIAYTVQKLVDYRKFLEKRRR